MINMAGMNLQWNT